MLKLMLIWGVLISITSAGSVCPDRRLIYPCICQNIKTSKKTNPMTIVLCYQLPSSDDFERVMGNLRSIAMDQFSLHDSYWQAHELGEAGNAKKGMPVDWISLLNMKELHIVDTPLNHCFACPLQMTCKNSVTQKVSITNSSQSERLCVQCEYPNGNKESWIRCMRGLKHFEFRYGKITTVGRDLFTQSSNNLMTLDLSHNHISKVEQNAFLQLPSLTHLNLSYNFIQDFENIFGVPSTRLEYLDLSMNSISVIKRDVFRSLPALKSLNLNSNRISTVELSEWGTLPNSLRVIQLLGNPLHCGCEIAWINGTYDVGMNLQGNCVSPDENEGTKIRQASRNMFEKCRGSSTRSTTTTTTRRPRTRQ